MANRVMGDEEKDINRPLDRKLEVNKKFIAEELGIGESYDVIWREIRAGGKDMALLFIDGLVSDMVLANVIRQLFRATREAILVNTIDKLLKEFVIFDEVVTVSTLKELMEQVMAGPVALLVDGEHEAIIIDARSYPIRMPEEPDLERVLRGSRDGFVETLVYNSALIRRRIRDSSLRVEVERVGRRSKSDLGIVYLKDVADYDLVQEVKKRIQQIDVDGIPMAEKTVEEFIVGKGSWWNPFPIVRYTERPDVAAIHLLEGHILVIVDTSPSVMIFPVSIFHHLQHAEEYRESPFIGVYLRWVRYLAILISWVGPPLWVLAAIHPELLPEWLMFIGPKHVGHIPVFLQFVMGEIGLDFLRLALIHTPDALSTSLGLIGAVLLGEMAVKVGLFAPEAIMYLALAALGTFATPSMEFAQAVRLSRFFLLLLVGLGGVQGFVVGILVTLLVLLRTRSFGIPYLWPLIPFNAEALVNVLFRQPVPVKGNRPSFLSPRDPTRMAGKRNGHQGGHGKRVKRQ